MGTWSPALYADDTTAEIRDVFRQYLESGMTHAEASSAILKEHEDILADRQVACLVYFALADTQWKHGCLSKHVRLRAIDLIETGGDIEYWQKDSPEDVKARSRVLASLRARLLSRQPPLKKVKVKPKPRKAPRRLLTEPLGSIFGLKLPDTSIALLKFVGSKDEEPLFRVLPWRGNVVPTFAEIERIAELCIPLDGRPEFLLFNSDGRKNPLQSLIRTGLVVSNKLPINTDEFRWINVEFLPAIIQEALKTADVG